MEELRLYLVLSVDSGILLITSESSNEVCLQVRPINSQIHSEKSGAIAVVY